MFFLVDSSESVLIPISKDQFKALTNYKHYHTIAMSSTFGKILDLFLLNTHDRHILYTNNLQFGFKRNHSESQCTLAVKEVIQYYNNKKSNVHVKLSDTIQFFSDRFWIVVSVLLFAGYCYT